MPSRWSRITVNVPLTRGDEVKTEIMMDVDLEDLDGFVEARLNKWYAQPHSESELAAIRKAYDEGTFDDMDGYARECGIVGTAPLDFTPLSSDKNVEKPNWSIRTLRTSLEEHGVSTALLPGGTHDLWRLAREKLPVGTSPPIMSKGTVNREDLIGSLEFEGVAEVTPGVYDALFGS